MNAADLAIVARISAQHGFTQAALQAAFEEGAMVGAMRAAQIIAAGAVTAPAASSASVDNDTTLSAFDVAELKRLGIDPAKRWGQRNSVFKVRAYNPNRLKYPVSVTTQSGARYKMTVAQVINGQK